MAIIRMLATDLDGTLIGQAGDLPLYNDFRAKILELKRSTNTVWVVCTGRNLASFREYFSPMRMLGVMPDFVIVNHAYIYNIRKFGYMPNLFWNLRIRYLIWVSRLYVREAIDEWHDMITRATIGVSTIRRRKDRLRLRFDSEEATTVAVDLLREKVKTYKHLKVFRYAREIDVRSVPFTKGLALSELAHHLRIPSSGILSIGNGHNDISMMEQNVAGMVGCPANSEDEVIEVVHKVGGHVAQKNSLGGALEILDAYLNDAVCSDLPANWVSPAHGDNPTGRLPRNRRKNVNVSRAWMSFAVVFVVLTVFANYGLIPYVSGIIMKPFSMLLALLEKILRLFL